MGQASRTTKLLLDLGQPDQGGANNQKRAALLATAKVLNQARAFYLDFFLAHAEKLAERVAYYSEEHLEMRERLISAHELLTWAERATVATKEHPYPWAGWNFSERFGGMPAVYRRSVIKDAIGKARSYLSNLANWEKSGKKKRKPGLPGAADHPTLYQCCLLLDQETLDLQDAFARLNVYTGSDWTWMHYPVRSSRYLLARLEEPDWKRQSPQLAFRPRSAPLPIPPLNQTHSK